MIWNVRGINEVEKQKLVEQAAKAERVDVAMLTETRLNKTLSLDSMCTFQTTLNKKGGCLTASTLNSHKRVKQLGSYMSWTNINTEEGEIQLLCCYIEPGDNEVTRGRIDKVTLLV